MSSSTPTPYPSTKLGGGEIETSEPAALASSRCSGLNAQYGGKLLGRGGKGSVQSDLTTRIIALIHHFKDAVDAGPEVYNGSGGDVEDFSTGARARAGTGLQSICVSCGHLVGWLNRCS